MSYLCTSDIFADRKVRASTKSMLMHGTDVAMTTFWQVLLMSTFILRSRSMTREYTAISKMLESDQCMGRITMHSLQSHTVITVETAKCKYGSCSKTDLFADASFDSSFVC